VVKPGWSIYSSFSFLIVTYVIKPPPKSGSPLTQVAGQNWLNRGPSVDRAVCGCSPEGSITGIPQKGIPSSLPAPVSGTKMTIWICVLVPFLTDNVPHSNGGGPQVKLAQQKVITPAHPLPPRLVLFCIISQYFTVASHLQQVQLIFLFSEWYKIFFYITISTQLKNISSNTI